MLTRLRLEGFKSFVDAAAPSGTVTYVVTALDRAYRESKLGPRVTVR